MNWAGFALVLLIISLYCCECRDEGMQCTFSNPTISDYSYDTSDLEEPVTEEPPPWNEKENRNKIVKKQLIHLKKALLTEAASERVSLPDGRKSAYHLTLTRQYFINLVDLYLPQPDLVNIDCQRDLKAIYAAMLDLPSLIGNLTLWPMRLVDSWGKFSDGLLVGNLKQMGFFHECLDIQVQELNTTSSFRILDTKPRHWTGHRSSSHVESLKYVANFKGQYCMLTYASVNQKTSWVDGGVRMPGLSVAMPEEASNMAYGTCMPSTCTAAELWMSVDQELAGSGLFVSSVDCQVKTQHLTLNAAEIVGVVLLSVICVVLAAATVCDHIVSHPRWIHHSSGPLQYLLAFSVTQNLTKLFHLDSTKSDHVISSIHGMRFLSITWVILGHQYVFSIGAAQNVLDLAKMTQPVFFQIMGNATLSVDTFFLMSGILVTCSLLAHMTKKGKFSPLVYYLHRFLRLLPPIALTVALVATVSEMAVSGPGSGGYDSFLKTCRHNWWIDITLVMNLILPHLQQMGPAYQGGTCLGHTWYVDVDTQLFIFMPLVLLPLYYSRKKGMACLGLATVISFVIPAIIIGDDHTLPTSLLTLDSSASSEYMMKVYMMPWCRAGPYLVGAWYGYLIHTGRHNPSITNLKPWQVFCGWLVAVGLALATLLGIAPYNYIDLTSTVPEMPRVAAVFYGALGRSAWAVAVGWVVLACHWGYGGPVNWLLSHPGWQPFSRLTYCMYLTSLPVQLIILYSIQRPTYYSHYMKVQETAGVLFVVFFVALFVSLVSEAPVLRLEKLLLRPETSTPTHMRDEGQFQAVEPVPDKIEDLIAQHCQLEDGVGLNDSQDC